MDRIQEFWYCVSPQENLPIYKGAIIESTTVSKLTEICIKYNNLLDKLSEKESLKKVILDNPDSINFLRLLLGISDKRMYLDFTYLLNIYKDDNGNRLVDEARENLLLHNTLFLIRQLKGAKKDKYADLMVRYFFEKNIGDVLSLFKTLNQEQISMIFNNLIVPKEIQQMQAKYRGHGAEQAFAIVCHECGLNIYPENKYNDPMGSHDPNVNLQTMSICTRDASNPYVHSFDLVIKDNEGNIKVLIQSLIHSSDPGQFGVDKSNETIIIKQYIDEYNSSHSNKVYLLGCVDGVGYSENPNGTIKKMIHAFDDFFQINTLFKIPLFMQSIGLIDNIKSIKLDNIFFESFVIEHFKTQFMNITGCNIDNFQDTEKSKKVGKAIVEFK